MTGRPVPEADRTLARCPSGDGTQAPAGIATPELDEMLMGR